MEADRIYDRDDCREAAIKTGDFFRRAQMPDPQPGWAQQYNAAMQPVWARKFEPPSITGGESLSVMRTLRDQLDPRGAWVECGRIRHTDDDIAVIEMRSFIRNLDTLARYAGAVP